MVSLDYKDFSSMSYSVTYSNIVYRFVYSITHDTLSPYLVRVPSLGHII